MPEVRKRPQAQLDLIEAWGYVATEANPEVADKLLDRIEGKLILLAENPGIGRSRPDIMPEIRSFPVERYNVYYLALPDQTGIDLVRVLHQRRDIAGEF